MICSSHTVQYMIKLYICRCSPRWLFITLSARISTFLSAHHDSLCNLPTLLSNCLLPPSLPLRCLWSNRPSPCGVSAGESSGGSDRVREDAVPESAPALRTPAPAPPRPARSSRQPHLAALFYAPGRKDTHRDTDP